MPENPYQSPEAEGKPDRIVGPARNMALGALYGIVVGALGLSLVMVGIEAYNYVVDGITFAPDWQNLAIAQLIMAVANGIAGALFSSVFTVSRRRRT